MVKASPTKNCAVFCVHFEHGAGSEDGENLGKWLSRQHSEYRDGTLQAKRQRKLESLGTEWEFNSVANWDEWFDLLSAYKEQEGHANAPYKHQEDGANL